MCKSPNQLHDGTKVACRNCSICKANIIKNWEGRIIAESKTSPHTYFVTLTYGRDEYGDSGHIRAAVLTYSDVQLYFKKLRHRIGKFKYFVVGEYGSEKGRAHWHLILFTPEPLDHLVEYNVRDIFEPWDHGFSHYKKFNYAHAQYCCKYVYKDMKDEIKIAEHHSSKYPPIGSEYFEQLAKKYVAQGLVPQDKFYSFADVKKRDGTPVQYMLKGKSLDIFLTAFETEWRRKYGRSHYNETYKERTDGWPGPRKQVPDQHEPPSDLMDDWRDKRSVEWNEKQEIEEFNERYAQKIHQEEVERHRTASQSGTHRRRRADFS